MTVRRWRGTTGQITGYLPPREPASGQHPVALAIPSAQSARRHPARGRRALLGTTRRPLSTSSWPAGENTLNFQLATRLYEQTVERGRYDADAWLAFYVDFMLTPGRHRDTYVEEYHREFFTNYARGRKPRACGVADVHIGGLTPVPALFAALADTSHDVAAAVKEHVGLTHKDADVLRAAACFVDILAATRAGRTAAGGDPGPRAGLDFGGQGRQMEQGAGRRGHRGASQPGLLHPGRVSGGAVPGVEIRGTISARASAQTPR